MAEDIKIIYDKETDSFDIDYSNGDLVREDGLESAVLISLFSDARVSSDEADDPEDLRGWWGDLTTEDDQIGSKLWLLQRSKTVKDNLTKARRYIEQALQWMIDDGVAIKIEAETFRFGDPGNDGLGFRVAIYKQSGEVVAFKYSDAWEAQINNAV